MGFSLKAMWQYKCPRCRVGKMYVEPLVISNPLNMNKSCSNCGQNFEPEPGFYYGAMFLSYIFSSFYLLIPGLILVFYFKWSINSAMAFAIIVSILSYLTILRGARSLWLHVVVKYDPEAGKEKE